jgi:ATP-dependent protease HslVU (ClpYQ) peptidase subunit
MCTTFVDSVRECLKVGGYASITNNEESGGVFLVAYKGNLYEIEGDFQVAINKDGYACCGSGMYYAYGSIYTSIKNKQTDIKKILKIALDSATNFNPFVGGSYKILFQKR